MFSFTSSGDFSSTERYLKAALKLDITPILEACGAKGVSALQRHTPSESGLTASSWYYVVKKSFGSTTISWCNSDIEKGFPVAVMIQYGYGTGTGGYVHGVDYINPALRPIFDEISERVSKAVRSI